MCKLSPTGGRTRTITKEEELKILNNNVNEDEEDDDPNSREIVWRNVIAFIIMHACIPYAVYYFYVNKIWDVFWFNMFVGYMGGLGVTAGAHRLWAHRAYKARLPLRIFLAFWFVLAGQNDLYEWCRDHRVHHKFSDTNADPHNINRGFFFAHMGWLCVRKHRQVFKKGKMLSLDDLLEDPVVRFQKRYYVPLFLVISVFIPTYAMIKLFNVPLSIAIATSMTRYTGSLHVTWLVNSAAHCWGYKPYNTAIKPRESPFVIITNVHGEGYHNYHHQFPQDYRASEFGWTSQFNFASAFIDLMACIGQAYDLKTAAPKVVEACKRKAAVSQHEHCD